MNLIKLIRSHKYCLVLHITTSPFIILQRASVPIIVTERKVIPLNMYITYNLYVHLHKNNWCMIKQNISNNNNNPNING